MTKPHIKTKKTKQLPPRKIIVGCDEQYAEKVITDQKTLRLIAKITEEYK